MTYLLLSLPFLTIAAAIGALATRQRALREPPGLERTSLLRTHLTAVALSFVVLAVLTAIFDSLMIASDLFTFGEEHLVGIYVGLAPIEDFFYPLMCVLILPSLWRWWSA